MDQILLTPLTQLETSLTTLLTSLTNTNTYTAAPAVTQSLLDADDNLSLALLLLQKHQQNHQRILSLRAEADRLQSQLQDVVRKCVEFRNEIGRVNGSILDDSDSDSDSDVDMDDNNDDDDYDAKDEKRSFKMKTKTTAKSKTNHPVSYTDLLSFAARIGKHNAAAAVEAERQLLSSSGVRPSQVQPQLQQQPTSTSSPGKEPNGIPSTTVNPATATATATGMGTGTGTHAPATSESLSELAAINATLASQRAYRGMAFPPAESLRMGELGRLQCIREQEGEQGVEREVERLVRGSERVLRPEDEDGDDGEGDGMDGGVGVQQQQQQQRQGMDVERGKVGVGSSSSAAAAAAAQAMPTTTTTTTATLPPKPKVALNLDLDYLGSDDEDDDD